ncbi:hypothetical protein ACFQZ4_46150 [Catellatospora coxensis]
MGSFPYLRVGIGVGAHRLRLTVAGRLDAASAQLLTRVACDAMRRHGAAVCEVVADDVTDVDDAGAAAVQACRAEAERRGLVFSLSGGPDRLRAAVEDHTESW